MKTGETVLGKFLNEELTIVARRKKSRVTGSYERDVFIVAPKSYGIRPQVLSRGNVMTMSDAHLASKVARLYEGKFRDAGGVLWFV